MTRSLTVLALAALVAMSISAEAAGNVEAGKKKAAQCQACHGMDGLSKLPEAPNLAGQNPAYLVRALGDYKSGARKNEMMSVIIGQLTPEDIADLSAYYSSIKITVEMPK